MSLLSIAQDVFDEVQIGQEDTIMGSTRPNARRALRLANSIGAELARKRNWQALRREHTFTAVAGEPQTSALPSDYSRMIPETFYDRTNNVIVTGPIDAQQWQALHSTDTDGGSSRVYIERGSSVSAYPAFAGGESLAFEYITTQWVEDSQGAGKTAFSADTDVSRIDAELLTLGIAVAWLASEGMPAGHLERRYRTRLLQITKQDQARRRILPAGDIFAGQRHWDGQPPAQGGNRLNGWY